MGTQFHGRVVEARKQQAAADAVQHCLPAKSVLDGLNHNIPRGVALQTVVKKLLGFREIAQRSLTDSINEGVDPAENSRYVGEIALPLPN